GRADGRYVAALLPTLPFADDAFAIALSVALVVSLHHAARRKRFIVRPSRKCAAWHQMFESFRCSPWAGNARHWSKHVLRTFANAGSAFPLSRSRTSFNAA